MTLTTREVVSRIRLPRKNDGRVQETVPNAGRPQLSTGARLQNFVGKIEWLKAFSGVGYFLCKEVNHGE